ncbi:two-component system sensor histidine kinase NtrB [Desulfoplanes formicivorans]|uniref:histidine kinase n=1 Tax=Desulfoplanes formicivorans TaxID=1592317 RepID=A0A194AHI2_9BACT|nr:ATP-binding protein [Desulfoplanes formicivorans]GAU08541.1 histidine kinase [Desulfoplanes formicivorans]
MRRNSLLIGMGLVGKVSQIHEFIQRLDDHALQELFPEVFLTGVVVSEQDTDAALIRDQGIAISHDVPALLAHRPDTKMLVVLEDDPDLLARLRKRIPATLSLVDARTVSILRDFVTRETYCPSCQNDLSTARSMLRTLLDEVADDILFVDTDGNILDVNKNVCERLGQPRSFFLGKPRRMAWDQHTLSWDEQDIDPFEQALRTSTKSEGMHVRIDRQGKLTYFRIYVYPILDDQSRVTSLLEMRRDISRRTHMEKQLQQSEKMAALGELAAYIAHEIRNPLVSIGGFAGSLLKMEELSPAALQKVQIILDESKRLDTILRGILNFARPTPHEHGMVEVNKIVEETMQVMGMGCEKQGVHLKLHLTRNLPPVHGRAEAIKQSLINVVKNGIESMGKGGELSVTTRDQGAYVSIEVVDTGTGIDTRHMEDIFNPFFSTKKNGSGLGLAMTKKVIEEIGGRIEVTSTKGQGTMVTLLLKKNNAAK